jgi:hypothetical protein
VASGERRTQENDGGGQENEMGQLPRKVPKQLAAGQSEDSTGLVRKQMKKAQALEGQRRSPKENKTLESKGR